MTPQKNDHQQKKKKGCLAPLEYIMNDRCTMFSKLYQECLFA